MNNFPGYDAWKTASPYDRPMRLNEMARDYEYLTVEHTVTAENGEEIVVAESEYVIHFVALGDGEFEITDIEACDIHHRKYPLAGDDYERIRALAYDDEGIRKTASEMWV